MGSEAKENIESALSQAAEVRPIIAIADSRHTSNGAWTLLDNPSLIRDLSNKGIRDFYLEIPRGAQRDFDDFREGRISKEAFRSIFKRSLDTLWTSGASEDEFLDHIMNIAEEAKKNGIRVHTADITPKIFEENPEMAKIYHEMARMVEAGEITNEAEAKKYVADLGVEEEFWQFNSRFLEERKEVNKAVADYIRNTMQGKGAVITFGAGHFHGWPDIDEFLGRDCVTLIEALPDKSIPTTFTNLLLQPDFHRYADAADTLERTLTGLGLNRPPHQFSRDHGCTAHPEFEP